MLGRRAARWQVVYADSRSGISEDRMKDTEKRD